MGIVQSVLSNVVITLDNSTMLPCTGPGAEFKIDLEIDVPKLPAKFVDIFGVELDTFKMFMKSEVWAWDGSHNDTQLGYVQTQQENLKFDKNHMHWDIHGVTPDGALMTGLILPMFRDKKTVQLVLSSSDVELKLLHAFGVKSPTYTNLKLEKTLTCGMLGTTENYTIPDSICHPALSGGNRLTDSTPGYSISCTPTPSSADIVV